MDLFRPRIVGLVNRTEIPSNCSRYTSQPRFFAYRLIALVEVRTNLPAKASVALDAVKRELERQIASIEAGEQAANAKLQAAIDTLQPAVDYHEYSRGGTA